VQDATQVPLYLEMCRAHCIEPSRTFSGKFDVGLDPADHPASVMAAAAAGQSLNEWIVGAIRAAAGSLEVVVIKQEIPGALPLDQAGA
jgi:predicted HicB family RNase H-like nuclease